MIKHGGSPTNCSRDLICLVSNDMALLGVANAACLSQ